MTLTLSIFGKPAYAEDFDIAAKSAFAVEVSTGKILYEKNSQINLPVGPTSKLLTAYLVYQQIEQGHLKWSDKVTISDYAYQFTVLDVSNVPLEAREYSVKELFKAMVVTSANGATIALAEHIAGSEPAFVDMMNAQLTSWGISGAKMVNATGLSNHYLADNRYPNTHLEDENIISAQGIATVAYHLLTDYPQVIKLTSLDQTVFDGETIHNYNLMLPNMPYFRGGIKGLATGTTEKAGSSFVAYGTTNGLKVITVVLNADGGQDNAGARFMATNDLLNHIAGHYYSSTILKKGKSLDKTSATILDGKQDNVGLISQKALTVIKSIDDKETPSILYQPPTKTVYAPIAKGQTLGQFAYEDKYLIGQGYLFEPPAVDALAETEVQKSFFLKVWWNHFVTYVNENL